MYLKQIELGPMKNYIYILGASNSNEVFVVDPAWNVSAIFSMLELDNKKLAGILITHEHHDHINGIEEVLEIHDVPVYLSKYEIGFPYEIKENIIQTAHGDKLKLGSLNIELLHTPGHSNGSQSFLFNGKLIAGDTLFIDGCGHCRLPGANPEVLYDTLYNKLYNLPNETILYPGHNYNILPYDSLKNQKKTNPFLQFSDVKSFVSFRMST